MKKTLSPLLAGLVLFGCAGQQGTKPIELSIVASSMGQNTPAGIGVQSIVDAINASGDPSISAKAFFDSQLGQANGLVQALQQGTVDIGVAGNAYFTSVVPELQVLELPFIFETYEEARNVVDGQIGSSLLNFLDSKGIKGLKIWEIGFRQLSNNKKAIKTVTDVRGLKLRSLPSPIHIKIWETYGALPSPLDSAELYTALQQGVFDGQENPISEIVNKKMYEVQKHISLTSHVYTPMILGMSEKTWNRLSDAQKQIVQNAVEKGTVASRAAVDQLEKEGLELLKQRGIALVESPDRNSFRNISKPVYDTYTEKYGSELLDQIIKK